MRLVLVVPPTGKVAQKRRIVLEGREFVDLGGTAACHVVIDDASVGTAWVRLERHENEWTVQDLEGIGKCRVGGVRLPARARRLLHPPLSLCLGDVECVIEVDAGGPSSESTQSLAFRLVRDVAEVATDAPRLRIAEGAGFSQSKRLVHGRPCIVGRGDEADFVIDDPDVSRQHCLVIWRDDRVVIKDLGSVAGTYLGKSKLDPKRGAIWPTNRMVLAGKTVLMLEPPARELLEAACAAAESVRAPELLEGMQGEPPVRPSPYVETQPTEASMLTTRIFAVPPQNATLPAFRDELSLSELAVDVRVVSSSGSDDLRAARILVMVGAGVACVALVALVLGLLLGIE